MMVAGYSGKPLAAKLDICDVPGSIDRRRLGLFASGGTFLLAKFPHLGAMIRSTRGE